MTETQLTRKLPRAPQTVVATLLMSIAVAANARAAQDDTCAQAYETAQELRADGLLRAARDVLRMCVRQSCQPFIRDDCSKWLNEVETGLPSVVFVARMAGRELENVSVVCDEELLTEKLEGRAIPLDPGKHGCRFEAPGALPAQIDLFIVEGQKNRMVPVELTAAAGSSRVSGLAPLTPLPARDQDVPAAGRRHKGLTLALTATALAGSAAFVGLGLRGLQQERRLAGTCAPACPRGDVVAVRTQYIVADVGLGVGLAAAAAAAYLFFSGADTVVPRGDTAPSRRAAPLVSAVALPGGGAVAVSSVF
jgi:hypothetical protein